MKKLDLMLRQEHRAGEKMFVDYAGATIPIHDRESGDVHAAAVFVAVLGASKCTLRRPRPARLPGSSWKVATLRSKPLIG